MCVALLACAALSYKLQCIPPGIHYLISWGITLFHPVPMAPRGAIAVESEKKLATNAPR